MNSKLRYCLILATLLASGCSMLTKLMTKSGIEYKIRIETAEVNKESIVDRTIKVTEHKLGAVGIYGEVSKDLTEPNVILVKVYGTNETERMKTFLFTTYQLELKKVISPPNPAPVQTYPTIAAAQQAVLGEQEVLEYVDRYDGVGRYVIVEKNVIVNGEDIRYAYADLVSPSVRDYQINFSLKPEGAQKFGEWTGKNIGNYLGVVLDGKVQSIAFIKSQIFDSGVINGRFTKIQSEDIALSLKSGYLPAKLIVVEERQFGN